MPTRFFGGRAKEKLPPPLPILTPQVLRSRMPHERGTRPEYPGGGIDVSTHLAFPRPRKILGRLQLEVLPGGLTLAKLLCMYMYPRGRL